MTQIDVMAFLKKHYRNWFTVRKIMKGIGMENYQSAACNMRRLSASRLVERKRFFRADNKYEYHYKYKR